MKNAWQKYDDDGIKKIFDFNEGYKNFISKCKTERECVKETIKIVEEKGYKNLDDVIKNNETLKSGDKVYANNMNKTIALFVIGEEPIENGMKILGAHIDSPRLDLKQNPLYEDSDLVLLDTHYYGGIKKYQWVTLPLAIHGVVAKTDGSLVEVVIGEDENDPVVGISDLLIHLSQTQMEKRGNKVVEGEDLNVLVGSIPKKEKEKDAVKANILNILKEKYNIEEEDFLSAELEIVPAGKARDYGIDRSMIMGYGHDDRVCAYTSLKAMLEIEKSDKTCVCLLVDKEEIGSVGATGAQSLFFENTVSELLLKQGTDSFVKTRKAMANSKMLSSDVSAGVDPLYLSVNDKKNAAYLGKGIVFNKYTGARGKSGSNDANPEYMAEIRKILDDDNIYYQTAELGKVDQGGGGTIAYILGNYNMNVIDAGVAVLNMHAPMEIVSKVDVYEAYLAYRTFLKQI